MIERPAGAPGLEQDRAAAGSRERELELAQIEEEIRRLESQAYATSSREQAGCAMECAIAGDCSRSGPSGVVNRSGSLRLESQRPYQTTPSVAPNGSFVMG